MSELDKSQQQIDRFLRTKNFKQAINYVTSLKQQGMSPENISFLQVYISKNMNKSNNKSTNDSIKKTLNKTDSTGDYSTPNPQTQVSHPLINSKLGFLNSSSPYLLDGAYPLSTGTSKYNSAKKPMQNNNSNQTSMIFGKLDDQFYDEEHRTEVKKDSNCLKTSGIKQDSSVVKLPSLNNLENDQYKQLKNIVKEGIKDLNGKINQKYFKSNAFLEQANYFNNRKEYDKAIEYFDQAMEVDTNSFKILMGKGDCLRKLGQYDASIECYDYALRLNPPHKIQFKILFNKGNVLKCQGKYKQAIDCYSKASLLDPTNPNTYFNKALTFYKQGDLDEVIDNYSRVVKYNPKDQHAFLNKGMALREIGEFAPAVECFVKASGMKAKNARQYLNKGNALFQIDKLEEALECFKKSVQLENNFYEAYLNMGVVLNELGRKEEELGCYNKVLQINQNDIKALYNQGIVQRELGDIEGSLKSFDRVLSQDAKMTSAYVNKGMSYYIIGQFQESYNAYKQALDIDKTCIEAYINMSQCLRQLKQNHRGLKILHKALRLFPQNSELYFNMGEIYREILNMKKALEHYTQAIQLNPIYSDAVFQKGVCLQTIYEFESAAKCLDLCIKFNPSNSRPHINKGQIYEVQGKLKSALRQYEIAATLKNGQEGDDIALLCKAHVYRERVGEQNKKQAIDIYSNLITRQNNLQTTKFQAYLGYSAIVIKEIINTNLQAIGRLIPITNSYTSSLASSQFSLQNGTGHNQNDQKQMQSEQEKKSEMEIEQFKITQLSGKEIEDAYFHLFCLLVSEIERINLFTHQDLQKIQDEQHSDFTLQLILRYFSFKKKQGVGSLGMGNGKHVLFMVLSYLLIGLKKREKKEFDESILYFEFLMNIDADLQIFCRYQSYISYLQSSYFQSFSKKISFPLGQMISKGSISEIYDISFDKDQIISDQQIQEMQPNEDAQGNSQQIKISTVNRSLLESFEKELICRKIKSTEFKSKHDYFYREFAMQNILNHRNIQKINYMYFDSEENLYMIEPKQKYNLETHLNQHLVSFEQRLNILLQICQAVKYLHSYGILHGSILMKNILIRNNDFLPLLTDFSNSRIFIDTYHSSSFQNMQQCGLKSSPLIHQNQQNSTFSTPDMNTSLSADIYSLGLIFEKMLLKIDQQDRMINNWYRKSFSVSFQMQKIIRGMLEHNKLYKRPEIQRIVDALQIEIIAAMLYNIYDGPFQFSSAAMGSQSKNSSLLINAGSNNNSMRNVFQQQQQHLSGNSSGFGTPANNQSALSLLQQQSQFQQQQTIAQNIDSNQNSNVNTPINMISASGQSKISRKQIKKLVPYQVFFNELEDIRQYNKMVFQLKVVHLQEVNTQLKDKIKRIFNFSYPYVQDLLDRELFLNSLSDVNLNFLVIIIKSIEDCTTSQQLKLIKDFVESIQERNRRLETENVYQYSQARLLYRLIGRSDPEKYRIKLMQKAQFKEQYTNIASIFLSDGIESIESSLRTMFLDALPYHCFSLVKNSLNNFTFPVAYSVQKKKLSIIEKFLENIQCLQLQTAEVEKLVKDSVVNAKLLQILKFDGYLRDLGEGVFDLLFKPLRDIIEKQYSFAKFDTQSLTDLPNAPIVTAKQYYQQKIKSIVDLEKEIGKIKKTSLEYLSANIGRKSMVNTEIIDAEQKKTTPAISPLIKEKNSYNLRRNIITHRDSNKSNPSLITARASSIKSLSQLEEIPSNYGQKRSDKKTLIQGQLLISRTSINQLYEIDEHSVKSNKQESSHPLSKKQSKIDQDDQNPNIQQELMTAATRSIVNIVVEEANNHLRQLKQYQKQQKQKNNDDNNASTRHTTNNQSENSIAQPTSERKGKFHQILTDRKNLSPTKLSTTQRNEIKIGSQSNIPSIDDRNPSSRQANQQNQQNGALDINHTDLIEEENYNQFIRNHLNQNLFGEITQTNNLNNKKTNSISNKKNESSLNHILSDKDEEINSDDEDEKNQQTITITNNVNKSQQKISIGGGLKQLQNLISPVKQETRNAVVQQIKMKKLNFSGIKQTDPIISLIEQKIPTSTGNKKNNLLNIKNTTKEEDENQTEIDDQQTDIKKQYQYQTRAMNGKISLMENVFAVEYNDLKSLYDNQLDI